MKTILAIDIGNTNIKALLIREDGSILNSHEELIDPFHPRRGQVEFIPEEIYEGVILVCDKATTKAGISKDKIESIGITCSQGSTVIWNKKTGKPIWNAITLSDDRGFSRLNQYELIEDVLKEKTGHELNTHSPILKIKWILDHGYCKNKNDLLFGTLGSWVAWKLSGGTIHAIDMTNAASTLMFNIKTLKWDHDLLTFFNIPTTILPEIKSCNELYGYTQLKEFNAKIPIGSMITKNGASLFGSNCTKSGDVHCYLGSSSYLMAITENPVKHSKLLTQTVGLALKNQKPIYCLEGVAHSTGSVIDWLKNYLGLIRSTQEIEGLAYGVPDSLGVFFVPALNGLSISENTQAVRGSFFGLSCNTNIGHMCRASLEGISLLIAEIYDVLCHEAGVTPESIKCSGGMVENNFLVQLVAEALDTHIVRSETVEVAALGAAYLAGMTCGLWKEEDVNSFFKAQQIFVPTLDDADREKMSIDFKRALDATKNFTNS